MPRKMFEESLFSMYLLRTSTCWEKYQQFCTDYECPICKTSNVIKPYSTRSSQQLYVDDCINTLKNMIVPREYIINEISRLMSETKTGNKKQKIKNIKNIMTWLLAGKKYDDSTNLILHDNFSKTVSERLRYFKSEGWVEASFGTNNYLIYNLK